MVALGGREREGEREREREREILLSRVCNAESKESVKQSVRGDK